MPQLGSIIGQIGQTKGEMMSQAVYTENSILDFLSMYQPKRTANAPEELTKFRNMDKYSKKKEEDKFFRQEYIKLYLDDKWSNEIHNKDSFIKIYNMLLEFPDKKYQIIQKLNQFKRVIEDTDHPYRALRIDFREFPFEESDSPDMDWEE